MIRDFDPEGTRLPIKLDSTSNGEFPPIPLSRTNRSANRLAQEWATRDATRRGWSRRAFLTSVCGAASTLLAFNVANAAAGQDGGVFALADAAAVDPELAAQKLAGTEFIFDVQGHFIGEAALQPGDPRGQQHFIKDVFLDSDTDMMVLSFVPSRRDSEPLTIQEADAVRQLIEEMEGNHRLLLHGRVNPNQAGDLEGMDELAERWGVVAWKTYTQWGPDGRGYFLSDAETGLPFIEKARHLGVKVICVHKGVPFGRRSYEHSLCDDIGVVAKMYPDVDFIVYHSGWVPGQPEVAYNPGLRRDGVDSLIRSLIDNDVPPNSNVYAELGSTWRGWMREPNSAAHGLGKLLTYVGENNVLWGTDSVWYGSPQDQIQTFRVFQISPELQEQYGYPVLTPELRAKVFGLNATKPYRISVAEVMKRASLDAITQQRLAYRDRPNPHFLTLGPKTQREFWQLRRLHGAAPG
ncbi:MAG: amidohydrolase [Candidatus Tectomicrobia bacterium]|nr:amidohydrolase [Candidatus Tectomicrobia bacterium]